MVAKPVRGVLAEQSAGIEGLWWKCACGLLLIYASYLVLRGAVAADTGNRAQLSAVYAVVTVIPATFLIWVVPRIPALQSLHPPNVILDANGTSPTYKVVLYASFVSFTM